MSCDFGEETKGWRMSKAHSYSHSRAHSPTFPSLHLRHNLFSNPSVALSTSQLILQSFRRYTNITAHSSIFLLLHLRHSSFSKPFRHLTYVTAHSPTLPSLYLRHNSFSNLSIASPRSIQFPASQPTSFNSILIQTSLQ